MSTKGQYPVPATYGQKVKYTSKTYKGEVKETGTGIFKSCWLGIEECWDVLREDGDMIHLYPCFGDTMEPLDDN